MKKRHIGYYTVMFVPEGNGRIFYIKVNKYLVRALILFLLVFFAGISFLVYKSAEIGTKIQLAYYLKAENERLREESAKLYAAVKKIDTMERTGDYLQRLADIINVQVASESPLDASMKPRASWRRHSPPSPRERRCRTSRSLQHRYPQIGRLRAGSPSASIHGAGVNIPGWISPPGREP